MSPVRGDAGFGRADVGIVPTIGRESLLHEILGGRTLLDLAVDLVAQVCDAVEVLDGPSTTLDRMLSPSGSRRRVLIHDPLCPLTPVGFVEDLLRSPAPAAVAVRPLVDTVKELHDGVVVRTVDRDALRVVSSPIVVDASLLAAAPGAVEALGDPARLVTRLRAAADVALIEAPPQARRVDDADDLRVLEAAQAVGWLD